VNRSPCCLPARFLAVFLVVILPVAALTAEQADAPAARLVILHVNDTHGRLSPLGTRQGKTQAGIARMATLVKRIRAENKGRVLLLHAGDIFSRGDALTVHYGGELNLLAMERIGYDAMTPGNGEFYFGVGNLLAQAAKVRFPLLLANVIRRENGKPLFQPYIVKKIAGVRVAILGLGFIRVHHPASRPLVLQDALELARKYAPQLRKEADLVIALTHIGVSEDRRLAKAVPEIDLIVGGHSHTRLARGERIPRENHDGAVYMVQAGAYGRFLGRVDVTMVTDGERPRVRAVQARLIPVDAAVAQDPDMKAFLAEYEKPMRRVLCTAKAGVPNPKTSPSPMGALVVEALHVELKADVALLDRGAVRSGIAAGPLTVADLCRIHPWRNRVLCAKADGTQLAQLLARTDLLVAGCTFRRTDRGVTDPAVNGAPVVAERMYTVVAGEYLVCTTPGMDFLPWKATGERVDTILQKFLEQPDALASDQQERRLPRVSRTCAPAGSGAGIRQ